MARVSAAPRAWLCGLVLAAGGAAGCARTAPCASTSNCPAGTVCELDGTCRAMPTEVRHRFAASVHLDAVDWAVTRSDAVTDGDLDSLLLGGDVDGRVHLSFAPLPTDREVLEAVLELHPHPTFAGPADATRIVVSRTMPFVGHRLTRDRRPVARGRPVADRRIPAGAGHPLRFDVTTAVEAARHAGHHRVSLSLRADRAPAAAPIQLASPRAPDARLRPRLSLVLGR